MYSSKIISISQLPELLKILQENGKKIVVAGGCFDILHVGHIEFLEKAKQQGDILFVLLESDESITLVKGKQRPINSQKNRARILSTICYVDFIVMLPKLDNSGYDDIISTIRPTLIATTEGDPYKAHKKRQAQQVGGNVVDVTPRIKDYSTTKLAQLLSEDL